MAAKNGTKASTMITPMMVPSVMPITATNRLNGVTAIWNPRKRFSMPMSVAEPALERALRHRHQEPELEDDEGDERNADREDDDGGPPVRADGAHVAAEVQRGRDVEPHEVRERDEADRRQQDDEHGLQALP